MGISALAQVTSTTVNGPPTGNSEASDGNAALLDFAALLAVQLPPGLQQQGLHELRSPGKDGVPRAPFDLEKLLTAGTLESLETVSGNAGGDNPPPALDLAALGLLAPPTLAAAPPKITVLTEPVAAEGKAVQGANAGLPEMPGPIPLPAAAPVPPIGNSPLAREIPGERPALAPLLMRAGSDKIMLPASASPPVPEMAKLAGQGAAEAGSPPAFTLPLPGLTNLSTERTNDAAPISANLRLDTPLHDRHWAPSFSERVVWLAKNELSSAQISINPPQLGPIQITVNLNGDQANALFISPHAEVRQAIQDAMPQLREMLAGAGINLGQANVGSQLAQQSREFASQFAHENRSHGENAILPADASGGVTGTAQPLQRGRGLVDLFA